MEALTGVIITIFSIGISLIIGFAYLIVPIVFVVGIIYFAIKRLNDKDKENFEKRKS